MGKGKVISLEDRVPKLKQQRRKKANRRLAFLLILFFLLIACIIYFQSPLSHVKEVKITGNHLYSKETLISLSEITNDSNIWRINKDKIETELTKLPEIKLAKVKIQLPNTVVINIEEWEKIAYIMDDGYFVPILENGNILEKKSKRITDNAPVLIGFHENDILRSMVEGLEVISEGILNSISEIHYTPTKSDKYHITLYMNDGFEVSASILTFSENMSHYPSIVSQLDPKVKGIIDLEVGSFFKSFEKEKNESEKEKNENEEG